MNYLELIVAFYRWKEVNPLPASAIALWHELVAVCNKAGWPEEFTVPNAVLQSNAGLSRKQFELARQMLIDLKRITYKKSTRVNNAGKYSIIYFPIVQKGQQKVQREGQREGEREEHDEGNERGNYIKDKQKLNETKHGNTPLVSPQGEQQKIEYAKNVFMTEDEYRKLTEKLGEEDRDRLIMEYAAWISGQTKRVQQNRDAYLTILNWHRRESQKVQGRGNAPPKSKWERKMDRLREIYEQAEAEARAKA